MVQNILIFQNYKKSIKKAIKKLRANAPVCFFNECNLKYHTYFP